MQTAPLADRVERIAIPDPDDLSDEALLAHCRRFVKTNYHPSGTCRMGAAGDPLAVLDSRLRVRGVDGLRVCDLSAMPNINAGNTAAPAMMLGSRCAALHPRRPASWRPGPRVDMPVTRAYRTRARADEGNGAGGNRPALQGE